MLVQNIVNYIDENDMSIAEFAKKCKVKQSTISNIINGYTRSPTLEIVNKIAEAMDMTIDELTKNDKKETDEIKKIYEKLKKLEQNEKKQIYAMMSGAIDATIKFRD